MINSIIRASVEQRVLVLAFSLLLMLAGWIALKNTPVDAIPDLSDVQVIVKTSYPGQAPQVVEDQITYPLTSALLAVPKAKTVRGFSFFGDSYIYIIFEEGTDIYWARSRVLEYLNQAASQLPATVQPQLGPDASGVGWVYLYALRDKTGNNDLAQLTSLQNWFLKFEIQSVAGVSEVATIGGMERQYQVVADPEKLKAFNMPLSVLHAAISAASGESGASVLEMAEAEYMVRISGYVKGVDELQNIPLGIEFKGKPLLLSDVADIRIGPAMRRGIAELNGQGESVGGIVVMRYGANAAAVISRVESKLDELKKSLPDGVEIVPVYDRSDLINDAVDNLWTKVAQELLLVALVCIAFLFHVRSALVAMVSLPAGILIGFIFIHWQGLNANIMSLGGIAIAIGAMIDGAIVMVENFHKHKLAAKAEDDHWQLVIKAASEVGPSLFFSLLIITVSFMPVFVLEAQEGRLFSPLAFTKTYAMAVSALLAITLIPVLMGYFIRGRIPAERRNPLNQLLQQVYQPILSGLLNYPKLTLTGALLILLVSMWPVTHIGSEFMPDLDEGDLMYMPTTHPGVSIAKARQILQQTDKLISTLPEVENVFGKIGRADSATDPAPLTMIETFIQLKGKEHWRPGMTTEKIIAELNEVVKIPGMTNAWVMPIKTRIDMLATGIKTPLGLKIAGSDVGEIQQIGQQIESILATMPETLSVYAERAAAGRYLLLDVKRYQAAQYGFDVEGLQRYLRVAIGGQNIINSIEGTERYAVNLRFPQSYRGSPESLSDLPLITPNGQWIRLADVADIRFEAGPIMLKSENARLNSWVFIDSHSSDLLGYVAKAEQLLATQLELPAGYSIRWAGQYEYMQRAKDKLSYIVPLTLALITILLYLNFRNMRDVMLILMSLPFALTGGIWLMYLMGFNFSIAVGIGFIALAGVAAETAVIMLQYLKQSRQSVEGDLKSDVLAGATRRIRPVLMTAIATIVGLLPVLSAQGAGAEVMSRIAAPMVGGMLSATAMTLLILPVCFYLLEKRSTNERI